jgi:hypothetical protein
MCKKIYREYTYYDDEGYMEACYEARQEELVEGLADIHYDEWFKDRLNKVNCPLTIVSKIKECLKEMIDNDENLDKMVDWWREELKEYFKEKASD